MSAVADLGTACRAYHDQYGAQFFSVLPTNLYGPNDNYHPEHSHVMAALIDKGFVYIAQPPLFKVAEGKKETFLKDEKEMSRFLLARIGEDRSLTSEMSGASAAG